jgi:hypothetical protein
MEAIELVVKVLLALIVVGFVGYPILKEEGDDEVVEIPEEQQELYRRKESTYSALKELEFDYKTGKLSDVDFRELDGKYRAEAIELLEAIESLEKDEEPRPRSASKPKSARRPAAVLKAPPAVEAEVAEISAVEEEAALAGVAAASPDIEEVNGASRSGSRPAGGRRRKGSGGRAGVRAERPSLCDACGTENQPGAKFCASCGESMAVAGGGKQAGVAVSACDECGAPLRPGYRFCGGCGAEVSA